MNGVYNYYYEVTGTITTSSSGSTMTPQYAEINWTEYDNSNYQDYSVTLYCKVGTSEIAVPFTIRELDGEISIPHSTSESISFSSGSPTSSYFEITYKNTDYGIKSSSLRFERK